MIPLGDVDRRPLRFPIITMLIVQTPAAQSDGGVTVTRTITYTYDPLNRFTSADYSTGEQFEYAYDEVGNRAAHTVTTALAQTTVTTYTYNAANRLTKVGDVVYSWDARGNLTSDGTFTYTYNAAGRMVACLSTNRLAESITATLVFTYNANDLRVAQSIQSVTASVDSLAWDRASGVPELLFQPPILHSCIWWATRRWGSSRVVCGPTTCPMRWFPSGRRRTTPAL
jgi:YD repeat-containing protein